jgi:hypothetical protein
MYRSIVFPVQLSRSIDATILGARYAVADVLRKNARAAVARAQDAGVDAMTSGQRMVMDYVAATRASKFLRAFPPAVARWCFQVEQHAVTLASESYPAAPAQCVASYNGRWLTAMPNRTMLVTAGGVRCVGQLAEGDNIVNHEIREVRLFAEQNLDGETVYKCAVIMSSDEGRRDPVEDPVEGEPELVGDGPDGGHEREDQ